MPSGEASQGGSPSPTTTSSGFRPALRAAARSRVEAPEAKVRAKRQRPSDTTQAWVRSTPRSTASSASPGPAGSATAPAAQSAASTGPPGVTTAGSSPTRERSAMHPVSSSRRTTPMNRSERPGWDSSTCQSQATWSRSKGMAASTSYCTVCSMRRASVKGRVTRWDAAAPGRDAAAATSADQLRAASSAATAAAMRSPAGGPPSVAGSMGASAKPETVKLRSVVSTSTALTRRDPRSSPRMGWDMVSPRASGGVAPGRPGAARRGRPS